MKVRIVVALALAFALVGIVAYAQSDQSRVIRWTIPATDTGVFLASCGDFDILWDDEIVIHGILVLSKDGVESHSVEMLKILGTTHYYNSTDPTKSIEGGPGESQQTHYLFNSEGDVIGRNMAGPSFKIVLPGYGPIFMETGQLRMRAGQVVFNSGWNQAVEEDVQALCDYLR